jgi:hypothetical protein
MRGRGWLSGLGNIWGKTGQRGDGATMRRRGLVMPNPTAEQETSINRAWSCDDTTHSTEHIPMANQLHIG